MWQQLIRNDESSHDSDEDSDNSDEDNEVADDLPLDLFVKPALAFDELREPLGIGEKEWKAGNVSTHQMKRIVAYQNSVSSRLREKQDFILAHDSTVLTPDDFDAVAHYSKCLESIHEGFSRLLQSKRRRVQHLHDKRTVFRPEMMWSVGDSCLLAILEHLTPLELIACSWPVNTKLRDLSEKRGRMVTSLDCRWFDKELPLYRNDFFSEADKSYAFSKMFPNVTYCSHTGTGETSKFMNLFPKLIAPPSSLNRNEIAKLDSSRTFATRYMYLPFKPIDERQTIVNIVSRCPNLRSLRYELNMFGANARAQVVSITKAFAVFAPFIEHLQLAVSYCFPMDILQEHLAIYKNLKTLTLENALCRNDDPADDVADDLVGLVHSVSGVLRSAVPHLEHLTVGYFQCVRDFEEMDAFAKIANLKSFRGVCLTGYEDGSEEADHFDVFACMYDDEAQDLAAELLKHLKGVRPDVRTSSAVVRKWRTNWFAEFMRDFKRPLVHPVAI